MKLIRFLILSVLVLAALANQAQTKASGVVFHDLNRNGIRERKEPGLSNVVVSNGSDVVLTDQNGRYELPVDNETIIFVIKPSDYNYPVNELNLPQFWYNHKPEGSPELDYEGVPPTGPLPQAVDFGLVSGDTSDNFSILVFADPQVSNETEIGYYETGFVADLRGTQEYKFGITLGDLVARRLDLFEPLNRATAQIGIPWFHVAGNHDINYGVAKLQHNDETFERTYGPSTYAFNHGKVHFIVLNNVIYPNPYPGHYYIGGFTCKQLSFVENSLKHVPEHYLVVLFMHIPLYDDVKFGETFVDQHREQLFELLRHRSYTFSMSGHSHALHHHFFDVSEQWHGKKPHHHYTTGAVSGDWWSGSPGYDGIPESVMWDGTPKGYSIIRFSGNSYTIDYRAAGKPEDFRMRLYGPKVVPQSRHFRGELFVNFFQGSKKDIVEYRIGEGNWQPMRYTVEPDPYICAIRFRWDHAEALLPGTRPSNPIPSTHLWKTRIPTNLETGANHIEVRVRDIFGRTFTDNFNFMVVPPED